jgi:pimeloyl-ACP methyl ester carboxylesterase
MLRETRALLDLTRMLGPLLGAVTPLPKKKRRDILVLPGFGAGDRVTWPLRRYLEKFGHRVDGWGLGRNVAGTDIDHALDDLSPGWNVTHKDDYRGEGSVPMLCDRMTERVRAQHARTGRPLTLVGWSLGGYVAREVARDLPGAVAHVITLGAPVQGGPKYTTAAPFFRRRGMDLDWIEREVAKRDATPISTPITAIVSASDGVVGHAAAIDHVSPNVRHVPIDAAHVGLCFNPAVWALIVQALDRGH